jgi:Anti-sigma-K factor rskA/Putative zinc-finger
MRLIRQDLHQLCGVYAVDALAPAERERFERHLHRCPSCTAELRGLQATAAQLGIAAAADPPLEMRAAVLSRAARTRQLPPVPQARGLRPESARWVPRLITATGAVAMAAVIAVLAVFLVSARHQLGTARHQLGAAQHQLSTAEQQRKDAQRREAEIAALLHGPGVRVLSARTKAGGRATVVVSLREHRGLISLTGLRRLPNTKVYQLWVIGPKLSFFRSPGLAGRTGSSAPVLATGLRRSYSIGVSTEPAGGVRAPKLSTVVAVIPLHA